VVAGLVAAGIAAPAWLLRDEAPRWRPGGSAAWPMARLAPLGNLPLALPAGGRIVCQGDSNTRGNRVSPGRAWPDRLAARLGPAHAVSNHGRGGAVVADARPVAVRPGDVVILCFGSNDAAPRGWLRPRHPVPPDHFAETLAGLAGAYRVAGASVLVMAPPPPGSEAMARRIAPYRLAASRAAATAGVAFADPVDALAGIAVPLQHDALHLNEAAHAALAAWLMGLIVPTGDQAL
jgi:lysophospholipase L1-like esterase